MSQVYCFDNWTFDADTGEVSLGRRSQRLEPTVSRLLEYFINNQGRLLTRDELIEYVWFNRIVTHEPINRCVSIIRQALSDTKKCEYIETVPRKGYIATFPGARRVAESLTPEFQVVDSQDMLNPSAAVEHSGDKIVWEKRKSQRGAVIKTSFLACALAIFLFFSMWLWVQWLASPSQLASPAHPSIVVMPFDEVDTSNYTPVTTEMTDTVIHLLSRISVVEVSAKTTSLALSEKAMTAKEIGEAIHVDFVLEGSVQIHERSLRVMARIIDTQSEKQVWSGHFDGSMDDIFRVQDDLVTTVVGVLTGELSTKSNLNQSIEVQVATLSETQSAHQDERTQYALFSTRDLTVKTNLTGLNGVRALFTPNIHQARSKNRELSHQM